MNSALTKIRSHKFTVFAIVAYALFIDYFIYGLIVPLSSCSPAKVTSESQLGLLYAAYACGVLFATPLFGHLGDKLGCRRPMIIGVLLSGFATSLFCFGAHFYLILLARLIQGAAAAATWTAGLALIAENYAEKRVQMMGLTMVGSTAGSVIGPVAGGWLFDKGGYQLPFLITGAMVLVDAILRITFLPPDKGTADKSPDLKGLLLDGSVLIAGLAVAVAAAGWGIIEPLLPVHLRHAGASPGQVGLLFTISTIAYGLSAPVVARVSEKFAIKKTICCGIAAMALTLPLLSLSDSLLITGFCLCLVNVAYAFVLNPTSAELGNAVDRRGMNCYAAVYAIYNITYSIGMMGSDFVASTVGANMPFQQILLLMSATLLACIPLVLKGVAAPPPKKTPAISQSEVNGTKEEPGNQDIGVVTEEPAN